jgi:acetyl-CoA acetyltransferase
LQLQGDAAREALAAAGLTFADVDGLFTVPLGTDSWMMPVGVAAGYFGMTPAHFATVDLAGASGCAMVAQAADAVERGDCEVALCVGGSGLYSFGGEVDIVRHMAETGTAHPQFELPHGPTLVSLYGLIASRYLHEFGVTREDLAQIAVSTRAHAARNPLAMKRHPLTVDDVLNSPMVSTPLAMLDCSIICDGAAAVVVTSADRARDLPAPPVFLRGYGQALGAPYVSEVRDLTTTPAVHSGRRAFARAGLAPSDIDILELYDCFTIAVLLELEDLGFCAKGEGAAFVAEGTLGPDGQLPTNTHGGLLSGGHPGLAGGLLHVVEAVRQLQGRAGAAQVEGARVALAHGNGGVAGIHATLILAGEDAA